MSSSDDFFGSGNPSLKFEVMGKPVGGRIVRVGDPMQQRDFATGAPKFWDKAEREPMMQLPIDVQTDLRDADIPGDTGARTLYVKGDLKRAVTEALRKAGAKGAPKVGGELLVVWTGEEPSTKGNPKKLYAAKYTAPAAGDGFFAETSASTNGLPSNGQPGAMQQAENALRAQSAQPVDPFAGQPVGASTAPAKGANPFADMDAPF